MNPFETAQHDFGVIRSTKTYVALRHFVAVHVACVGHFHADAVQILPQARVAAVGARGGRVRELGAVAGAFGDEGVVAVAGSAVGFVQAGAVEPGVDVQRDAGEVFGEGVGGCAVVDRAVGGRWARGAGVGLVGGCVEFCYFEV